MIYAVYVDEFDTVWLTDFGANVLWRFDPETARFARVRLPTPDAAVRQLLGQRGEVWGAESGTDKLGRRADALRRRAAPGRPFLRLVEVRRYGAVETALPPLTMPAP